ncbi:hypothetical protein JO972_06260 [Verrucomicrobiaceae bacterium 5K15]|uniref:Uncharacterized protein n=1 Tax=Oceaniferula flava TaxID=2800421 RepID=A0AAE2SA22_9BACT|nr:hypothetical protein [Oceaniferula flavus]MBK1854553.1 hypothetical protein [Oceaniferula flavus]MBM1135859.1 hypothetical protein [Oceaniferula flavus]
MKRTTTLVLLAVALTSAAIPLSAAPPAETALTSGKAELNLSYQNLRQLIADLKTKEYTEKPAPPVAATIRSAAYQFDLSAKSSAKVTATFSVTTFADGWSSLPLVSGRYSIASIEPASSVLTPNDGKLALLTHGAGEHSVTVTMFVPALPDGSFSLETVAAAAGRLNLVSAEGYQVQGAEALGDGGYVLPSGGGNVRIAASRKTETIASTWSADSRVLYVAKNNELQAEAHLQLNAKEGDAATMAELQLPKNARVISCEGPDLSGWTETSMQQIKLQWKSHGINRRRLILHYSLPLPDPDETWTLNIPRLANDGETRGQLAIVTPAEFQLTPTEPMPQIEASMAADWMKSEGIPLIVKLPKAQNISFTGKRLTQIQAATATIKTALFKTQIVPDGSTLTEGALTISHRDPKLWSFTLPADSEILTCQIDGRAANPIVLSDGSLQLSLPAKQSASKATSEIKLSFTSKLEKVQPIRGKLSLALPATPLFIHEQHWLITLPEAYEASAVDGNLTFSNGKQSGRAITLVKRLCRNQAAQVDIFYRKQSK